MGMKYFLGPIVGIWNFLMIVKSLAFPTIPTKNVQLLNMAIFSIRDNTGKKIFRLRTEKSSSKSSPRPLRLLFYQTAWNYHKLQLVTGLKSMWIEQRNTELKSFHNLRVNAPLSMLISKYHCNFIRGHKHIPLQKTLYIFPIMNN